MEKIPPQPPALEENELNLLRDECDDTEPEEQIGIPQSTEQETPNAQEFVELNYKGFNIKLGSCRLLVSQLADLSYNYYNLLTKGGSKDENKHTTYT